MDHGDKTILHKTSGEEETSLSNSNGDKAILHTVAVSMKFHYQTPILTTMLEVDGTLPLNFSGSHDFEALLSYESIYTSSTKLTKMLIAVLVL